MNEFRRIGPKGLDAWIAPTKHVYEAPVLRGVAMDVDADTLQNLALHDRVHEASRPIRSPTSMGSSTGSIPTCS